MIKKNFSSGDITQVSFDPTSRHLELVWRNKTVIAHKPVPEEIFRRLCSAPNRATYYEDRISDRIVWVGDLSSVQKLGVLDVA